MYSFFTVLDQFWLQHKKEYALGEQKKIQLTDPACRREVVGKQTFLFFGLTDILCFP